MAVRTSYFDAKVKKGHNFKSTTLQCATKKLFYFIIKNSIHQCVYVYDLVNVAQYVAYYGGPVSSILIASLSI